MNNKVRTALAAMFMGFGAALYFTLMHGTIILNTSDSMPGNAYLVYDWPIVKWRGTVVATNMPEALSKNFGEFLYVKEIRGIPGDLIDVREDGTVCIRSFCAEPLYVDGEPFAPAIASGEIPAEHYAVFGNTPNSLDSRYELIGLIPGREIKGSGFVFPLPHWKELGEWLNG